MPPAIIQNGQGMIPMESKNFEDSENAEDVGKLNKDWSGVEVRFVGVRTIVEYCTPQIQRPARFSIGVGGRRDPFHSRKILKAIR